MAAPKVRNQAVRKEATSGQDFFDRIEYFLGARQKVIFLICTALTAVFSFLLFDGRLSFATDDATYVLNAYNLIQKDVYPNFQGALYPLVLGFFISVFDANILFLKTLSVFFIVSHSVLLYFALRGRMPYLLVFSALLVSSVNAYILVYASSTFSEGFFMFMQALSLYVFFKLLDKVEAPGMRLKNTIPHWLLFGFVFLLLSITKNVAIVAIGAVFLFFLLRKEWINAVISLLAFGLFKFIYEMIVRSAYGTMPNEQMQMVLQRDPKDPSKGLADMTDFIERFTTNFGNYFSVHVFKMLGLRGSGITSLFTVEKMKELNEPLAMEASLLYGLIFIILAALALYYSFKHNRFVLYILLYFGASTFATFIALHTFWNQDRLVLIFLPLIFLGMCYGLYKLAQAKYSVLKPILAGFIILCLLLQLGTTFKAVSDNNRQFSSYRKGNMYYGYPAPIQNFAIAAEWAGENIKEPGLIATGKPSEAVAFGRQMKFTRVPSPISQNADSVLAELNKRNIKYFLIDGFDGRAGQAAQIIYQKYGDNKVKVLFQEGDALVVSIED
ncbi:MAG: hypothetical protein M3Q97_05545 [Bacteroidota bacterium]|nr:hypothetical protein [Bacteroidota bacterium]